MVGHVQLVGCKKFPSDDLEHKSFESSSTVSFGPTKGTCEFLKPKSNLICFSRSP